MPASPDRVDLSHLRQVIDSRGYSLIEQRLQQLHQQAVARIISAPNWEEVLRLQGQIEAFHSVIAVPKKLVSDLEKKLKGVD